MVIMIMMMTTNVMLMDIFYTVECDGDDDYDDDNECDGDGYFDVVERDGDDDYDGDDDDDDDDKEDDDKNDGDDHELKLIFVIVDSKISNNRIEPFIYSIEICVKCIS